jgi:VWFA-related protein
VRHISVLARALAPVYFLSVLVHGQTAPVGQGSGSVPQSIPSPQQPAATLHKSTRMVTLEVVARDHHGQPVPGLAADDFEISEQIASKKERHPQKIAAFRAVSVAELAPLNREKLPFPAGVYTNVVTLRKVPVPPTILLIDGLNTEPDSQMRVHQQMVRMLASIPEDIPLAVFLLGRRLKLIQNFTTDPKLLRATLQKISIDHAGSGTQLEPQDDPDAMSALLEGDPNLPAAAYMARAI